MPGRTPKKDNAPTPPVPQAVAEKPSLQQLYNNWSTAFEHEQEFAHILAANASIPAYGAPEHEDDYMNVRSFSQGKKFDNNLGERIRFLIRSLKQIHPPDGPDLQPPEQSRVNTLQSELDYRKALQLHVREQRKHFENTSLALQHTPNKRVRHPQANISRDENTKLRARNMQLMQDLEEQRAYSDRLQQLLLPYLKNKETIEEKAGPAPRKRRQKSDKVEAQTE